MCKLLGAQHWSNLANLEIIMKENWPIVLKWMGLSEGGYVNDPQDNGGPTNHGITHKVLAAWRGKKNVTITEVKALTKGEASEIFKVQYWDISSCDRLRSGVDYAVCDYAINSGTNKAGKDLQRTVNSLFKSGLKIDGQVGINTIAAIDALTVDQTVSLISAYCHRRWAFMKTLKSWKRFKNGWTTRVMGKRLGVQTDDIGVIDRATRMAATELPIENIPAPIPPKRPDAKAEPEQPNIIDAMKKPDTLGLFGSIISSLGAVLAGSGPIQWALSALLVIFGLIAAFYLIKRIKTMDPA